MKTLDNNAINEIIINKSRFICEIIKLNDIDNINEIINTIKTKYKDATHYCYAYIFENIKRFSDDGEPAGTAGMPILNVLESNELSNVICIVIRYFGGIKLGAGGLVRAYTKSVTNALDKVNIVDLEKGKLIQIIFDYNDLKKINHLLIDTNIINKSYDNVITYKFIISNLQYDLINNKIFKNVLEIKILEEIYI